MAEYVPFGYRITAAGAVRITRGSDLVTVVAGGDARRLVTLLGESDERDQALLQRATGNYRRGNERR